MKWKPLLPVLVIILAIQLVLEAKADDSIGEISYQINLLRTNMKQLFTLSLIIDVTLGMSILVAIYYLMKMIGKESKKEKHEEEFI